MQTKKLGKGKILFLLDQSDIDDRLKNAFYVVEASSEEKHAIWRDNQYNVMSYIHDREDKNETFKRKPKHEYEQDPSGFLMQVGTFHKEPVCISIGFCKWDGQIVMFYEATSNTVNHDIIQEWLKVHCNPQFNDRRSHTNANNFHHCVHAIEDFNEEKERFVKRKIVAKKLLNEEETVN